MAFSTGGRGPFNGQMNVTPLIDVLLVLIIVFMVVVSMAKESGVEAQIPQPARHDTADVHDPETTIVIQVAWVPNGKNPAIKINQEIVPWDNLQSRLEHIYTARADKVAYVKGDDELDFEYVAQVIAEAHNAGVQRVGLMTTAQTAEQ
jgi:biopolymer transport protein ExbD